MRRTAKGFVGAAVVLAGYAGVVVALTWPLAAHVATHLAHTAGVVVADIYLAGWALAWQTHALATDPLQYANANIYAPTPHALFYGNPGFALVPFYAPVFLATGNPTLALNLTVLSNLALTATTLHLVTVRWTGSPLAGVAAALTYLTSSGALQMAGYLPVYAAFFAMPLVVGLVSSAELSWRRTIALAALVAYQSLTDVVYVGPPLLLALGLAACGMLLDRRAWPKARRVVLALVLALFALAPIYAGYLGVRRANAGLGMQTVWTSAGTTHLPYMFAHRWLPPRGPLDLDGLAFLPAALGLTAMLAGVGGGDARERRAWRYAGILLAVGWLLAWGIPRQGRAIREIMAASFARDLPRLAWVGLIGAALLAGLGFAACARAAASSVPERLRRLGVATLLLAFLATRLANAMWLPGSYPIEPAPPPLGPEAAVLRQGHGPVLVLPLAPKPVRINWDGAAMYQSVAHWRPLVNGYAGYQPAGFEERMEVATRLPDPTALATLRRETGLTTIVVSGGKLQGLVLTPWRRALASRRLPDLRVAYDDGDVLVLDVVAAR